MRVQGRQPHRQTLLSSIIMPARQIMHPPLGSSLPAATTQPLEWPLAATVPSLVQQGAHQVDH